MENDKSKPILKFEPGSRQPFILYLISITIISAVIVIVCLLSSGLSFSDINKDLLGDVNLDGKINTDDASLMSKYFSGQVEFSEEQLKAADADKNGVVNSKDTVLIMQHIGVQPQTSPSEQTTQSTTQQATQQSSQPEEENTTEPTTTKPQPDVDFVNSGKSENAAFLSTENGVYYIARISNSWQSSNGKYMYQIDFTVKNNSSKTVYNTSADVNFSNDVMVEKNWGCSAKNETGVITVTTKNEGRILSGGTFNCGFVVSSGSPITIESITK